MSGQGDEDKDIQKAVPLDLARSQITTVRTVDGKSPLVMTSQSLRGMRVVQQAMPNSSGNTSVGGQTIITTNIVPQAVLKQDSGRAQLGIITSSQASSGSGNLTIQQRPAQITLSTTPLVAQAVPAGTSYHVPRGPAVVANLAAPRSNVATAHAFVRPPRTPSPAQGTAWLTTNSSNGGQIKGAPTVLSSPVRGATVTGKPQLVGRTPSGSVSTIRPGTILQNAIIAQPTAQIHPFKPGSTGIQTLGSSVTIAQVLPSSRTQAVVYTANTSAQFTPTRITVASTIPSQRQASSTRPIAQVTTARLTVPVNVSAAGARLVTPQTVLTSGARLSTVQAPQQTVLGSTTARIVSTQANPALGRLTVTSPAVVSSNNLMATTRLNLHSLVAVTNAPQQRNLQPQGAKVITQPAQGTIHLASIQSSLNKTTTQNIVTTGARTISVPAAIVTQRQATVIPSQAISIAKVFPSGDNQGSGTSANVFIHAPVQTSTPKRLSPSPNQQQQPQQASNIISSGTSSGGGVGSGCTTVAGYSLPNNTYFYEAAGSVARTFGQQQPTSFSTQQIRPATLNAPVHGIVASNQSLRYNQVMLVEQNRNQTSQFGQSQILEQSQEQQMPSKTTSSPRPSILRKREHEGSPLKASKNLTPLLTNVPLQSPTPVSPPSRPDSRGNGHSSAGSTTISATSSPGLAEVNEDSMPHAPIKEEEEDVKPPMELSPRKKPRKQQLTGSNDISEQNDDMQFISDNNIKKEEESDGNQSDEPRDGAPEAGQVTTVRKPASASLLNSYRQTWKATHNHYLRYSDVRPKDERRPSIMDLANQYRVQEKVNGWKVHHLSTQMQDLADQELAVYNQLKDLLKCTESGDSSKDKDVNRINELIKGNMQRIQIIKDGMTDAETQIMKIFQHQSHVTDIINRCASKRNFKKRDKSS